MGEFSNRISEFRIEARNTTLKVYRASLLDLFSSVVLATPVDKGFLRNGWIMTQEVPAAHTPKYPAPTGQATIDRLKTETSLVDEKTYAVFLVNNFVYGPRIEYDGWSAKAPNGMVRINTIRWPEIVQNNRRKYGS